MTIQDKFDTILKTNRLGIKSIFGLEKFSGVGVGSVSKFLNKGESPTIGTIKTIQDALRINPEWWDSGNGSIYLENGTGMDKSNDNKGNGGTPSELYRDLVESNSEYRLVPKVILDRYEILSQRELESRERVLSAMLDQAKEISATKQLLLDEKDKLIVALEEEIYELRVKLNQIPPPEGTQ